VKANTDADAHADAGEEAETEAEAEAEEDDAEEEEEPDNPVVARGVEKAAVAKAAEPPIPVHVPVHVSVPVPIPVPILVPVSVPIPVRNRLGTPRGSSAQGEGGKVSGACPCTRKGSEGPQRHGSHLLLLLSLLFSF
jgi:hypothetical protein